MHRTSKSIAMLSLGAGRKMPQIRLLNSSSWAIQSCNRTIANFQFTRNAQFHSTSTATYGSNHSEKDAKDYEESLSTSGDHLGRQQNHIWSKEEIDALLANLSRHEPVTLTDKAANKAVRLFLFLFLFRDRSATNGP
jgi:hypothetical protein